VTGVCSYRPAGQALDFQDASRTQKALSYGGIPENADSVEGHDQRPDFRDILRERLGGETHV
jgi:hypothetical protein